MCFVSKILKAPITARMRDEALKPLSDAMKDVVCHTIEEQFKEFTPTITKAVKTGEKISDNNDSLKCTDEKNQKSFQ